MAEQNASEEQPQFRGDQNDLEQFLRLVASPIRSEQRDKALREWEAYKLSRQAAYVRNKDSAQFPDGLPEPGRV